MQVWVQVDGRAQRVVVRRAGRHLAVAEEARYWVEDWVGGWVEYFLLRHLVHLGDLASMADSSFPPRWKRSVRPVHRVERNRRHYRSLEYWLVVAVGPKCGLRAVR